MSKKNKTTFICSTCGAQYQAWTGKCQQCQEWNTIEEQMNAVGSTKIQGRHLKAVNIKELEGSVQHTPRSSTGINDVDAVLGGGIVDGSVVLLAGQPGIGKSTLLMQIADNLSLSQKVLYVSGEESVEQVALRAGRLKTKSNTLDLVSSNSTNDIVTTIAEKQYGLVIVDSVQTITCDELPGAPGSMNQITNSTHLLTTIAKKTGTPLVIVGHVTKEGSIAGPKLLEHMVDVVLNLEGDRYGGFKILRAIKNRYGSTEVTGIFEMSDKGLVHVDNPSKLLLSERQVTDGSIVLATMEGNRPILVEIQALVNTTAFGYPKRTASGFDINRLNLLIAVLEKRTKLQLSNMDVYINVVGGIKISDPAADLAVCMAIGSAAKGLALKHDAVVFGEVGLSGEIRHVSGIEKRIAESKKLDFQYAIGPQTKTKDDYLKSVGNLKDALNNFLSS